MSKIKTYLSIALAAGLMPFRLDDNMQSPPGRTLQRTPEDDEAAKARAEAKRKRKAQKLQRMNKGASNEHQ